MERRDWHQAVRESAERFNREMEEIDRRLRRTGSPIPSLAAREDVAAAFWKLLGTLEEADEAVAAASRYQRRSGDSTLSRDAEDLKASCRILTGKWLWRSRIIGRSTLKPHGYTGDFLTIEWCYDLEDADFADPLQPAIVNCLDYAYSTLHSVQSLWDRRRWFLDLVKRESAHRVGNERGLSILDLGCGGARYLRDFLAAESKPGPVSITLVDQDPCAIEYCRRQFRDLVEPMRVQANFVSAPIRTLTSEAALRGRTFDLIISAGMFDYLADDFATLMLGALEEMVTEGGAIAISNFHPEDPSRVAKDWLGDWKIVYRTDEDMRDLFPNGVQTETQRSGNGALLYAVGRKPVQSR